MMNVKKLSDWAIKTLKNHFCPVYFPKSFHFVYEDQIPTVGIVLLEGEAVITKKNKTLAIVGPGTILGIEELLNNEPTKYGCKIKGSTKAILIPKSEISEMLRGNGAILKQALNSILI